MFHDLGSLVSHINLRTNSAQLARMYTPTLHTHTHPHTHITHTHTAHTPQFLFVHLHHTLTCRYLHNTYARRECPHHLTIVMMDVQALEEPQAPIDPFAVAKGDSSAHLISVSIVSFL